MKCRSVLEDGFNPKIQQQAKLTERKKSVNVKEALEYWLMNYAEKNRSNYLRHRAQFERHVYPHIGDRLVEQCDTAAWVKVLDDITKGTFHRPAPKAAGYILQNCKQVCLPE